MAFDAFPRVSKQYSLIDYQLEMRYSVCIFVIHLVLENRLLLWQMWPPAFVVPAAQLLSILV